MLKTWILLMVAAAQWISPPTVEADATATASVQSIRYWAAGDYTRVIVDLDLEAQYENARLSNPDRIYFDISNARLSGDFTNRALQVEDGFLTQVRAAQNRPDVVRVVLNVSAVADYSVSELHNPFRIVIDLHGPPGAKRGLSPSPQSSKARPDEIGPTDVSKQISEAGSGVAKAAEFSANGAVSSPRKPPRPDTPGTPALQARATAIASVRNIRYLAAGEYTRVLIDMDQEARYEDGRLSNPDRVYFDISNATLSRDFLNRTMVVEDKFLKQVRAAQNRPDVVRVVLDISTVEDYSVSRLPDPPGIVIDLRGKSGGHNLPLQTSISAADEIKSQDASKPTTVAADTKIVELPAAPEVPGINPPGQITESKQQQYSLVDAEPEIEPSLVNEPEPDPSSPVLNAVPPQSPGSQVAIEEIGLPVKSEVKSAPPFPSREGERPITVNGTVYTGYYNSFTRGGGNGNQSINFVPAGATFDINGYYVDPDVLNYTIQTELNSAPQASDAGFQGGNGVGIGATAFRHGAFPVTFHYSNMQLKDAYFGSLTQISSYTLKNRNKDLGLTAGLNIAGLPTTTLDVGTSSVQSQSLDMVIPDYVSHSNHLNLSLTDKRWGWDFQGFAGRQRQTSNLISLSEEVSSSLLQQDVMQYRGSARRSFLKDSELYLDGGSQATANTVLNQPIDLTTRYANANLRMFQRRRWKTSLRAGYTSNIAGLAMTQLVGGLGSNGSIAPDSSVLRPLQRTVSYLNLSGLTSVDLSHGFSLYGSVDRTAVLAGSDSVLSSRYVTTAGGMAYSRAFQWGSFSGQYGRTFGVGSITGQAGRIEGQNYVATIQPGKPDGLQFDFSIRGSDQSVHNELPVREHSLASDAGVGFHVFGQFRARLGGGWQRSIFANEGNEFRTNGYTARAGIEHPRFQLSGSLNSNVGNALQSYSQVIDGIGVGAALLTPLHLVPSDFRGVTIAFHMIPIRRLEFSALYTRSVQHLEGTIANDFEVIDVSATFHFRRLELVAGYFSSNQIYSNFFAAYPNTERGRYYVRITRPAKFL